MIDKPDSNLAKIREKIKDFPVSPGVYLMKDTSGRVLYIGKAKSLRDRVKSYFLPSADLMQSRGPKIQEMANLVKEVSYIKCDSEVDAILKEARLIKDIQPPYNTRQMDDKTFPYLEISRHDDFPGVYVTRQPRRGNKLYGPFTSAADLRRVIQVLQRIFKFRTCTQEIFADNPKIKFTRPCILYNINQCTGPCAGKINKHNYSKIIQRLKRFMESERAVVLRQLQKEMLRASAQQDYEEAARLRNEIGAIESLNDRGSVDEHVQPELFQVNPEQSLQRLGYLINKNLGVRKVVRIIEGVDIAHIMGQDAVGSLVCFIDGRPFKNGYRRFRIKYTTGIDDYAMIQEVLQRRYRRVLDSQASEVSQTFESPESSQMLPDIILIDGGLGQLNAAQDVLTPVQNALATIYNHRIVLMSLAKKEETVFIAGADSPLKLPRNDNALQLLQYVRDEAHRFAQHYFHILHHKRTLQ